MFNWWERAAYVGVVIVLAVLAIEGARSIFEYTESVPLAIALGLVLFYSPLCFEQRREAAQSRARDDGRREGREDAARAHERRLSETGDIDRPDL